MCESSFPECPRCGSQDIWLNGFNSAGTREFRCKSCRKTYVAEPYKPDWVKTVASRMIGAEIAVSTIEKVLAGYVSKRWIFNLKKEINVSAQNG